MSRSKPSLSRPAAKTYLANDIASLDAIMQIARRAVRVSGLSPPAAAERLARIIRPCAALQASLPHLYGLAPPPPAAAAPWQATFRRVLGAEIEAWHDCPAAQRAKLQAALEQRVYRRDFPTLLACLGPRAMIGKLRRDLGLPDPGNAARAPS